MASRGSDPLQDSLSCDVCYERYNSANRQPKILRCQHTFCNSCISVLMDKSTYVDLFYCPVCRDEVYSDEVCANLAVRDIVEAVLAKEKAKLFCPTHPSKECQLACVDCCQLLCAVCMIKGEHVGHTIDDMDDAEVKMKKRLTTAVKTKISNLKGATTSTIGKLTKNFTQQEQELNTIVLMITEYLNEWKKTQLQAAQKAIDKEQETRQAQQAHWKEKLQVSDLQSMTAYKETEAEDCTATDVSLPKVNLDKVRSKLNSLCDTLQTVIKDNAIFPHHHL